MNITFGGLLKHAWNAFLGRDPTKNNIEPYGAGYGYRPDRIRFHRGSEKTILSALYTRIAVDVCSSRIEHVRIDENDKYKETIKSGLNRCLTLEANTDQIGRSLIQDLVMSMFDEGCVALIPTDTTLDPNNTGSFDITSLRVGRILEWFPKDIRVDLYDERDGVHKEVIIPKKYAGIFENPHYAVMNEPNSTAQRLVRKISLLDTIDENAASGKLDLIIQLPFTLRTKVRIDQAEKRRKDIENQLAGSKYGIAYIDSTERVIQLNRSAENNLLTQIQYLTDQLYSQLGMTPEVFLGTADEKIMQNYYNRTIEPILDTICTEIKRKFLTKTAVSQGQSIMYFTNPFKMTVATDLAEIADKMTRNEIMSPNEIRALIGYKPSNDAKADELRNRNLNEDRNASPSAKVGEANQNESKEG